MSVIQLKYDNPFVKIANRYPLYSKEINDICCLVRRALLSLAITMYLTSVFLGFFTFAFNITYGFVFDHNIPIFYFFICCSLSFIIAVLMPLTLFYVAVLVHHLVSKLWDNMPVNKLRDMFCKGEINTDSIAYSIATRYELLLEQDKIGNICQMYWKMFLSLLITVILTAGCFGVVLIPVMYFSGVEIIDDSHSLIMQFPIMVSMMFYIYAVVIVCLGLVYTILTGNTIRSIKNNEIIKAYGDKICTLVRIRKEHEK